MNSSDIQRAYFSYEHPPQAFKVHKRRGARRKGVIYEEKVQKHFKKLYPCHYLASPWLHFQAFGKWQWCQPDGLHFNVEQGIITVVEVKLSHTSKAYHQIYGKYIPVLQKIFYEAPWSFRALEVVRWFDPHAFFPGACNLRRDLSAVQPKETGVLICTP